MTLTYRRKNRHPQPRLFQPELPLVMPCPAWKDLDAWLASLRRNSNFELPKGDAA